MLALPSSSNERIGHVVAEVHQRGFSLVRPCAGPELEALLQALGTVIDVTEVVVKDDRPALVTSRRYLSLHTDHHRARFIVWRCLRSAPSGGVSLIADGRAAYLALTSEHQAALRRVQLKEHAVFTDGQESHPMITGLGDDIELYYSYWLTEQLGPREQEAFEAFSFLVEAGPRHEVRLDAGDVLVVDNHKMLHGRTAIKGEGRHLRRYWIEHTGCRPRA